MKVCDDWCINAVRACVVALMVGLGGYFLFVRPFVYAQSPISTDVVIDRLVDLRQRVDELEIAYRVDHTVLAVLSDNMTEVKILGRTVAGAICVQLALAFLEARKRRKG